MPGNLIRAICGCGYEKELSPGYALVNRKGYSIAYTQDGNELETFEEGVINRENLQRVVDPFVMSNEEDEFIDALDPHNIKPEEMEKLKDAIIGTSRQKRRPIKCPKCKNFSLFLHDIGHWD